MELDIILTLSTAYLSPDELARDGEEFRCSPFALAEHVDPLSSGWTYIYLVPSVSELVQVSDADQRDWPGLLAVLREARKLGARYVRFDPDLPPMSPALSLTPYDHR